MLATFGALGAAGSGIAIAGQGVAIAEFDDSGSDGAARLEWQVVDDGVMGGLSQGNISMTSEGTMLFRGNLSLENNGGFSSVRTEETELDLSSFDGVAVRVKGDGRAYQLRLGTDATFRSMEMAFKADFETREGQWVEVRVPFESFVGSFRGRLIPDVEFDASNVRRLGFLLADKNAGPFALEVDWVRGYNGGTGGSDLVATALADGRFQTLAKAVTEAGLLDALRGDDPLTVFAPTDEAFGKLPEGVVADLLKPENRERLKSVLTYHVAGRSIRLGDALKAGSFESLQGSEVNVRFENGRVKVNDSLLTDADIAASNGVIHVIDTVLLPPEPKPQSILATAKAAGSFGLLVAAIEEAGLADVLNGDGPFTVLAPTDDAISNLPEEEVRDLLKKENREQLAGVLTYHVIPGAVSAGDALNAGAAKTLNGASVRFAVVDGRFRVNDSTVLKTDIECSNGVIHVIDSVLMPPAVPDREAIGAGSGDSAAHQIMAAISEGVPLYNSGDPAACASVYENCIATLTSDQSLDCGLREGLATVLQKAKASTNADTKAWLYRHALDQTVTMLTRPGQAQR